MYTNQSMERCGKIQKMQNKMFNEV